MGYAYNYRIGDLELRSHGTCRPLEIVKWESSSCYGIASWSADKEGDYSMRCVGHRPFDDCINWVAFGKLAKAGQEHMDEMARMSNP